MIAESVAITVGMVLVIIFLAYLTHRFGPTMPASTFTEHLHLRGTRFEKDIERHILDTIPVVKYDSNLQLSEPHPVVKMHDLGSDTTPLRRETPAARDAVQETQACKYSAEMVHSEWHNEGSKLPDLPLRNPNGNPRPGQPAVQNTGILATADEPKTCSICIADFKKGDNVRILPCNHMYHRRCIDPWILNFAGPCPLCKKKLPIFDSSSLTPTLEYPARVHIPGESENRTHSNADVSLS